MTHQQQTAFENIVGKEENARNEQFLLFPQCFLLNKVIVFPFFHIFDIISLLVAKLEEPKIGISGKGLTYMLQESALNIYTREWFNFLIANQILDLSILVVDIVLHTGNGFSSNCLDGFVFKSIGNIMGKGEKAGNQHFLLFP